nr:MAG TPA: hypothetical protein [Caudoviricetes sp.]
MLKKKRTDEAYYQDDEILFDDMALCGNGYMHYIMDYTPPRNPHFGSEPPKKEEDGLVLVHVGDRVFGTGVADGKPHIGTVRRVIWNDEGGGISGLIILTEDTCEEIEIYV